MNRFVIDWSVTVIKENAFGVAEGSRVLGRSCFESNKDEAAKFVEYCITNNLTELRKTKVKITNDG